MPVAGPLPQTGDQQDIDDAAGRCFKARCPRDWRVRSLEGPDDYGLDFNVQTTPGQQVTDVFRVQLKGTGSPDLSADGAFLSIQIKASTIRYYDRLVEPVLLVVCDLSVDPEPIDCPLYYVWLRDELRRIGVTQLPEEQRYVTLRVPIANKLRGADLSSDIQQQNELSRAGHAIDMRVEKTHPGMKVEERVSLVKGVTKGVTDRSATFIDALAAPSVEYWVNPPQNSLPWHLIRAKDFLLTTRLALAGADLDAAEGMMEGATALEQSEYWFLRGKLLTASSSNEGASAAFEKAYSIKPLGRYLAAWAETELRVRYYGEGPSAYPDVLEKLEGDDPLILAARSRILAAEGRFDESISTANEISGAGRYAARALTYTTNSKPTEALADCDQGLAESDLSDNTKQLLLLLRARALFSLAHPAAENEDTLLSPSGSAGIDPIKVWAAWHAIEDAIGALREAGWSANIEYIADIWGATASNLGKQKETLAAVSEAACAQPRLENVQACLESLAAQCGEFDLALEANDRLPESQMRNLRRTILLHSAQKHQQCFRWFEQKFDSFDHTHLFFGHATTAAALSAYQLAQPDLVEAWAASLELTAELRVHGALLEYYLTLEKNKLGKDESVRLLLTRYEEMCRPFDIAVVLLQELDPADSTQAEILIEVSVKVLEKVELSTEMAAQVGFALTTTNRWQDLLSLCQDQKAKIDTDPRLLALEALALDRLGKTAEARQMLEQMLARGQVDSLALKIYVNIMVRCGYAAEAIEVAENILEAASTREQRIDCIRLLFNLIQSSDSSSSRLLALARQMGALTDRDSEVEEGVFILMYFSATLLESNDPTDSDHSEFQKRASVFSTKFPNSKIIRTAEIREDATAAEILSHILRLAGVTESQVAFRTRIENQLQQGLTMVPFFLRPRLILSSVHDVVHLWEIAKKSGVDDRKFHLPMISGRNWSPPTAASLRDRTPLLDITALLVLFDLGLIDNAIEFFGEVAIAKSTLETLAALTNIFSGSTSRSRCIELQNALKPHLSRITQLSIASLPVGNKDPREQGDPKTLDREHDEIIRLCNEQQDQYRLYSDDLAFRALCSGEKAADGICTLDVLVGMEEIGAISRKEVATKVAKLCAWRVAVLVRYEDLVSLIPTEIEEALTISSGTSILEEDRDFAETVSAVWDFRSRFVDALEHAAAVLRRLADDSDLTEVAVTSVLLQWYARAGLKKDAPSSALELLTKLVVGSAQLGPMSNRSASRLWAVYRQLLEHHHGSYMDVSKERDGIQRLGVECGKLYAKAPDRGEVAFKGLKKGLTEGTSDYDSFSFAYSSTLIQDTATRR